jgi:hypothetical protein
MDRTVCQIGKIARNAIAQNSIQRQLIMTNKRKGAVVLMPISAKCKNFAEGYHKNAKFLVRPHIPHIDLGYFAIFQPGKFGSNCSNFGRIVPA